MMRFHKISFLTLIAIMASMSVLLASSQGDMPSLNENEKPTTPPIQQNPAEQQETAKKEPTVPQKIGREAARLDTQAKDAMKDVKHGWKGFKQKHKEKKHQVQK